VSCTFAAELYVHAIAIEREAAERYAELAGRMDGAGNHAVAALLRMLSSLEAKHLDELRRRAAGVELPPLTSDYTWRDSEAPETAARDLPPREMTQRRVLEIALQAEKAARAFFEHAGRRAADAEVRELAAQMAAEEAEHAVLIERMLLRLPAVAVDWRSTAG
jgi:rubrerythrin